MLTGLLFCKRLHQAETKIGEKMQINAIQETDNINFKGPLDSVITTTLRTFDKNPMVNAVGIDLVAMVGPRTFIDAKKRNKYAGAETFIREFMSTLTT